jgi:hypothetical protein
MGLGAICPTPGPISTPAPQRLLPGRTPVSLLRIVRLGLECGDNDQREAAPLWLFGLFRLTVRLPPPKKSGVALAKPRFPPHSKLGRSLSMKQECAPPALRHNAIFHSES